MEGRPVEDPVTVITRQEKSGGYCTTPTSRAPRASTLRSMACPMALQDLPILEHNPESTLSENAGKNFGEECRMR